MYRSNIVAEQARGSAGMAGMSGITALDCLKGPEGSPTWEAFLSMGQIRFALAATNNRMVGAVTCVGEAAGRFSVQPAGTRPQLNSLDAPWLKGRLFAYHDSVKQFTRSATVLPDQHHDCARIHCPPYASPSRNSARH